MSVFLLHPTAKTRAIPVDSPLCPADATFKLAAINHEDAGLTSVKKGKRFSLQVCAGL